MVSFLFALIPCAAALLGGALASLYTPKERHAALLQYFVAGIVIAAVVTELLPRILHLHSPIKIGAGFLFGIGFMVLLHQIAHLLAHHESHKKFPLRLIGASAIDLFIDGLLIGITFLLSQKSGPLITLSLTPCAFFLTLTVSGILKKNDVAPSHHLLFLFLLAVMLPLGAFLGNQFGTHIPGFLLDETIAASIAALLYLGIEEFLVEAHRKRDNHWVPLAFFLGFLIVLLFRA